MELEEFAKSVDFWIKSLNRRISDLEDLSAISKENADNTLHNYELIYELKDQVEELKQEIKELKLVQILCLKQKGMIQNG